jgi:hypothetical protein
MTVATHDSNDDHVYGLLRCRGTMTQPEMLPPNGLTPTPGVKAESLPLLRLITPFIVPCLPAMDGR